MELLQIELNVDWKPDRDFDRIFLWTQLRQTLCDSFRHSRLKQFNHLVRASFSCVFAFAFWHKEMKLNFLSSIINKTNRQKLKKEPC